MSRIHAAPLFFPLSVLALGSLSGAHALAADLHVGSGQTYATVQDAANAAAAGDNILVHTGSYTGDVDLTASGTSTSRITLMTANDGAVTVTGRVTIDGDYWDVMDIAFVARQGTDGFRLRGNNNRIMNIELSGGDNDGIDGGGDGNEVRDSSIHDFDAGSADAHCIVLNPGAQNWVISGNELYDCSGDAIQLYAGSATRLIINTLIENNHMYFTGGLSRTENAIDVKDADGLTISGNLMHDFPDNKIVVFQKAPTNINMSCNVMYNGFTGVEFRGEDGGTVENITFAHNVMSNYSSYALKFDGTDNGDVFNNTFVDIGSDGLRIEGAGLNGGTVRNNLFVNTGNIDGGSFIADTNGFFNAGNNGIASGSDVNADPLLDAEHKLMTGSPMIDQGVDVGLPFDGTAPDIGWHETGMAACSPIAAGGGPSTNSTGAGAGGAGAGAGGGPGSGPGATSGAGGANADGDSGDDGGCGCRTAGGNAGGAGALIALLALCLAQRRRR